MIETNPGMNLVDASIPGAVHEAVCELLCPLRRLRRSSLRVGTYEAEMNHILYECQNHDLSLTAGHRPVGAASVVLALRPSSCPANV